MNAFQPSSGIGKLLDQNLLKRLVNMAEQDPSQIVRLYLASAAQRLAYSQRWGILNALVSHPEDVQDNNLPRMYWFALEPMVPLYPEQSLDLAVRGKIPQLQEFVARVDWLQEILIPMSWVRCNGLQNGIKPFRR